MLLFYICFFQIFWFTHVGSDYHYYTNPNRMLTKRYKNKTVFICIWFVLSSLKLSLMTLSMSFIILFWTRNNLLENKSIIFDAFNQIIIHNLKNFEFNIFKLMNVKPIKYLFTDTNFICLFLFSDCMLYLRICNLNTGSTSILSIIYYI